MIINLTPHPIRVRIVTDDDLPGWETLPPASIPARVEEATSYDGRVAINTSEFYAGAAVVKITTAGVVGLPAPQRGTTYVVSRAVAEATRGRPDIVFPIEFVRDDSGQIIGAGALGRF